jgi:hypothetical protein
MMNAVRIGHGQTLPSGGAKGAALEEARERLLLKESAENSGLDKRIQLGSITCWASPRSTGEIKGHTYQ